MVFFTLLLRVLPPFAMLLFTFVALFKIDTFVISEAYYLFVVIGSITTGYHLVCFCNELRSTVTIGFRHYTKKEEIL